jgi:hypothetical protein
MDAGHVCIDPGRGMNQWKPQPDGSRVRMTNGIRLVDRTTPKSDSDVEHLVTWQEDGGRVIILGLDTSCRPVMVTTLYSYL